MSWDSLACIQPSKVPRSTEFNVAIFITRGKMKITWKALAGLLLVATLAAANAQTTDGSSSTTVRKHKVHRTHKTAKPSVESQIQDLRKDMDDQRQQIEALKQQLSQRDSELQQAQQTAAAAQASAQQAQQTAQSQQQSIETSNQSVSNLQTAVSDLKTSTNAAVANVQTVQTQQTKLKAEVENPDAVHYKGVTLSPAGSFLAAETVWRQGATGGGINTAFTGVPLNNSPASQISEFDGTGRQSRIALKATGKTGDLGLTGYYEADFLSAGVTSNNNQSNSYTLRQRQLWGQAAFDDGWKFTGGQMWSLTTETTQLLNNGTEILPSSIDPQYMAGFVWNRQFGFRASKDFGKKFAIGASAENDQMLLSGSGLPAGSLIGSVGSTGGLYNNQTNYSFNLAPELVAKMAFEPGWGHWEIFGVGRFFHNRIYPNYTAANSGKAGSATGAFDDSTMGGGIGGGFRAPLGTKNLTIGLKGLYGDGTGRMGSSTIADTTLRPDGQLALLHTFSSISTVEANLSKRLMVYLNYGGDYAGRRYFGNTGEGYGSPFANMSGCTTETFSGATSGYASSAPTSPANCSGNTKDVQEVSFGDWYDFYHGSKGRVRFGLQYAHFRRDIWSGNGGTTNPGNGAHGDDNMFWSSFRYYLP